MEDCAVKDYLIAVIPSIIVSIATCISIWVGYIQLKKQIKNSPQTAKEYLKILLELLENIEIVQTAVTFEGKFCPIIEHRMPTLAANDNEKDYSFSQRAFQFRLVVRRIIRGCQEVNALTPTKQLPKLKKCLTQIKVFFKDEMVGLNAFFLHGVAEDFPCSEKKYKDQERYSAKLQSFYTVLENLIEEEISKLRKV